MFVQMGTTLSRFTGITLGCVVYQKTSGLPIVGDWSKVQGEDQGSSAEGWESLGEGLMEAERLWRL